uniref:4a-hydroxytetrahydrobiopterin dehydratase n=2 Tax=Amorphochlora amoebiformis TaxID=1561963 RepID=A0A7S0DQ39_9EUKA
MNGQVIMGVVNLSPDSWYRESVAKSPEAAIRRGTVLSAQGAQIVDIGAESTTLTAERVSADAQQTRLIPVVKGLSEKGILVSCETYDLKTALVCLDAGAAVINLTGDLKEGQMELYKAAAMNDAGVIVNFTPGGRSVDFGALPSEDPLDPSSTVMRYFETQANAIEKARLEGAWMDPGLGFYHTNLLDGKARVKYQIDTLLTASALRTIIGWPVCVALPHAFDYFENEVRTAEAFFGVLASIGGGVDLYRTHEVTKVRGVLSALESHGGRVLSDGTPCLSWEAASDEGRESSLGCRADTPILTDNECIQQMGKSSVWEVSYCRLAGRKGVRVLRREIRSTCHSDAMRVMAGIGEVANRLNHHPNIAITGTSCDEFCISIESSSAAVGGLTAFDLALAQAVDDLAIVQMIDSSQ